MNNVEKFKTLYKEVFDSTGTILPCGRRKCMELIEMANRIKPGNYGDSITGFLNIIAVKDLYNEL